MNIKDLLDSFPEPSTLQSIYTRTLNASNLEESELIQSIAKLLYRTKSVRKVINVLDRISEATDLTEIYSLPKNQIIFGYDKNKPIGYISVIDKRNEHIKHNLYGISDDFNIKILDSVKNMPQINPIESVIGC